MLERTLKCSVLNQPDDRTYHCIHTNFLHSEEILRTEKVRGLQSVFKSQKPLPSGRDENSAMESECCRKARFRGWKPYLDFTQTRLLLWIINLWQRQVRHSRITSTILFLKVYKNSFGFVPPHKEGKEKLHNSNLWNIVSHLCIFTGCMCCYWITCCWPYSLNQAFHTVSPAWADLLYP